MNMSLSLFFGISMLILYLFGISHCIWWEKINLDSHMR